MSVAPSIRQLPRACGRHREAAIALYRALLLGAQNVPGLNVDQCQQLQNVVRNRFKENKHNSSGRWLRLRFVAGYQGLDLLDAAREGNAESQSNIIRLLDRTPDRAKQSPPPANAYPRDIRRRLAKEARKEKNGSQQHQKSNLFDRPLPLSQLSGRRHIPRLFSANKIPVLRIKKPMPPALASYIARRIKVRQKRIDSRDILAAQRVIASREDEWDAIVSRNHAAIRRDTRESWQQAILEADQRRRQLQEREHIQNRTMAEKMQRIVDEETRLYEQEKQERKDVKWRKHVLAKFNSSPKQ